MINNVKVLRRLKNIFAICTLIGLLTGTAAWVQAQSGSTLRINKATGTVGTGNPCPAPRSSAVYSTIQAAIACAQNGDTLEIAAGTYNEVVLVNKNLTINGASAATSIINAGGAGNTLTVANGIAVKLTNLTITGGNANFGGGVFTNAGNIEIRNSVIKDNIATTAGGGIFTRAGTITLINSTLSNNQPAGEGGGIFTRAGTVTIQNSTISGHVVNGQGGGVRTTAGTINMTNTTVSGNTANVGGGIESDAGTITLGNVTVANNNSGIVSTQATVNIGNTVLASNNNIPCTGVMTSSGHNVIAPLSSNCTLAGVTTGNVTGVDPKLGLLKANGGLTQTQALLDGSPALDAGSGCAATDQRGAARPQGSGCDVGAYEGIRGDCNADILVDAGDISALTLEIFDGDGNTAANVPNSTFAGDSVGCNPNKDSTVDAGDLSCTTLLIFNSQATCIVP